MMHDYCQCRENKLTPIGYSIMLSTTEEFQQSDSHLCKVIQAYVKHNINSNCTQVRGDFIVDSQGGKTIFCCCPGSIR